jgi:hypothetical protein
MRSQLDPVDDIRHHDATTGNVLHLAQSDAFAPQFINYGAGRLRWSAGRLKAQLFSRDPNNAIVGVTERPPILIEQTQVCFLESAGTQPVTQPIYLGLTQSFGIQLVS